MKSLQISNSSIDKKVLYSPILALPMTMGELKQLQQLAAVALTAFFLGFLIRILIGSKKLAVKLYKLPSHETRATTLSR